MDKVQHFEIPADDMSRARKFYSNAFSWKITDVPNFPEYLMTYTVEVDEKFMAKEPNAINGGITKRTSDYNIPIMYITVDNLEASIEKIKSAGGSVITDIKDVPGMGRFIHAT